MPLSLGSTRSLTRVLPGTSFWTEFRLAFRLDATDMRGSTLRIDAMQVLCHRAASMLRGAPDSPLRPW